MKRNAWGLYGLLFGPIELLIMRFFNGNLSLIQTVLVMIIISSLFMIIPMFIKIIMKTMKKDFFAKEGLFIASGIAALSVALSWLIVLIIDGKDDSLFSIIVSICLLDSLFVIVQFEVMDIIYRIVYGNDESHLSQLRYNMKKNNK